MPSGTYAVFMSCPDQGIKEEEEKRYEVQVYRAAMMSYT